MSKLLLVDGSALLHRAYHAYPPLKTKSGVVVGAVYGVTSILIAALEEVKPTHVMVAWDLPKPTFRHIKYVGYKAQRPKADSEMVEQIPLVKEVIGCMGVVQVEQEGFEADDIIGTLATTQPREHADTQVIILTGDQDTMQLANEHVRILTPAKGQNPPVLYGPDEVFNKYGVHPEQIVDYKALIGDPSDNIPGVAGVGPTTASKLLREYGNLQEIYAQMHKLTNVKVREKLEMGRESAFLSQDLSRIVWDMPLNVSIEEMEYRGLQGVSLKVKLEELGFKSLVRRIFPEKPSNQIGLF